MPLLTRAQTLSELTPDPRGKYFVGRTWLSFLAAHARFSGTIVWGCPSREDVQLWGACADLRLAAAVAPHATLFDGQRIDRLTAGAYGELARYAERDVGIVSRIGRLALVHWGGYAGAVAAGFTKLVPLPFPAEIFEDAAPALAWLGCEDDAPLLAEVRSAEADAKAVPALLRQLAALLVHQPRATAQETARALALSTRSLQRRLAEHGTTFRRELDAARLNLAQRLLLDTDAPVTTIALEVGLTSPQHLSTLFRRFGHESPQKWRALARAAD